MTLSSQLLNLSTRLGTEFKSIRGSLGNLASLTTVEKGTLVGAINEIRATVASGGTIVVDAITDASTIGKTILKAADGPTIRAAIGAGTSSLQIGSSASTAKAGNYVPSWGEVSGKPAVIASGADANAARTSIGAGTSNLAIGTTSSTAKAGDYQPTWAQVTGKPVVIASGADQAAARTSIGAQSAADVDARISGLIGGAPAALDTLGEIAAKLAEGDGVDAGVVTALGNRVRVDAAQSFTEPEKLQARSNIDVYSKAEIGNPETNLVAVFEAALV